MRQQKLKDSSELIGKIVHIVYKGNDGDKSINAKVELLEEDGIIISYYTEEDDITSTCSEEDDSYTIYTQCFIPWTSVHSIAYRSDEKYP